MKRKTPEPSGDFDTVAVVGMGIIVPRAKNSDEFWHLLLQSETIFSEPKSFDIEMIYSPNIDAQDKSYVRTGGFLENGEIDAALSTERTKGQKQVDDPASKWLRHSLIEALHGVHRSPDSRFGCYIGCWAGGSLAVEETLLLASAARGISRHLKGGLHGNNERIRTLLGRHYRYAVENPSNLLPHRMVRLAIDGVLPSVSTDVLTVDTACSSSLYAVDIGVKSLLSGARDIAVCGGVYSIPRRDEVLFCKLHGMSKSEKPAAYDANADGILFCEAAAVVVLKTMRKAVADGDTIHGLLAGFGASSDGRGMAITAPNPRGQRLAVQRARHVNRMPAEAVDWVIGHGTGTPAGDAVELSVLAELAPQGGYPCTSNKSLLGHPSWAAGAVSVIHGILGLKNHLIPSQRQFSSLPDDTPHGVRVPVYEEPLPLRSSSPRTVGISSFGFGGTNAHLLLQDVADRKASRPRSSPPERRDSIYLIGWSAHLPGFDDPSQARRWLLGESPPPALSFGAMYPLPSYEEFRLPPVTSRGIDRTQIMALDVARKFVTENGKVWAGLESKTGVIVGHTGPTRSLMSYGLRICSDDLRSAIEAESETPEKDLTALEAFLVENAMLFPPSNDDSMPGLMPNIIASRLASVFDLHGLTMAIDNGHASFGSSMRVAASYLQSGELDIALVIAVNGNSTPEIAEFVGLRSGQVAEGALMFALARESTATTQSFLPIAEIQPL